MSAKTMGTVPDWTAFLDVRAAELDEAMRALQRGAIDTSVDLQRFARRIRGAPNEELQVQASQLSSAMGLVVMEIGVTRRSLIREVAR
jgi:hypothetical protein